MWVEDNPVLWLSGQTHAYGSLLEQLLCLKIVIDMALGSFYQSGSLVQKSIVRTIYLVI